jgi:hypothetical protein
LLNGFNPIKLDAVTDYQTIAPLLHISAEVNHTLQIGTYVHRLNSIKYRLSIAIHSVHHQKASCHYLNMNKCSGMSAQTTPEIVLYIEMQSFDIECSLQF